MSYEGYVERICKNGHYSTQDAMDRTYNGSAKHCDHEGCVAMFDWTHEVNETNGYDETDPSTFDAPKKEVGFTDKWCVDHYGNRYAVKVPWFAPDSPEWKSVAEEQREIARWEEKRKARMARAKWMVALTAPGPSERRNFMEETGLLIKYDKDGKTLIFYDGIEDMFDHRVQFDSEADALEAVQLFGDADAAIIGVRSHLIHCISISYTLPGKDEE